MDATPLARVSDPAHKSSTAMIQRTVPFVIGISALAGGWGLIQYAKAQQATLSVADRHSAKLKAWSEGLKGQAPSSALFAAGVGLLVLGAGFAAFSLTKPSPSKPSVAVPLKERLSSQWMNICLVLALVIGLGVKKPADPDPGSEALIAYYARHVRVPQDQVEKVVRDGRSKRLLLFSFYNAPSTEDVLVREYGWL